MSLDFSDYDRFEGLSRLDVPHLLRCLRNPFARNRAQAADDLAALGSEACGALTEIGAILLSEEEPEQWVRETLRSAFEVIADAVRQELESKASPFHQLPLIAA